MLDKIFEEEENKQEKKEEVVLKIIISRHGPKLSAEGEKNEQASYFKEDVIEGFDNMDIKDGEGLVGITTSDVKRAVNTAEIQKDELKNTDHRMRKKNILDKNLAVPFQPLEDAEDERFAKDLDIIKEMQKKLKPEIKKEIEMEMPDADEKEKEAELRNRIDINVLTKMFEDENKKDKKFNTSYQELADIFAKRYFGFAKHIGILKKMKEGGKQPRDEKYLQIDVSHSFPIMAFLKKYLVFKNEKKAFDMKADDFFKETGGIIRESGNFGIEYILDEKGTLKIEVEGEFKKGKVFNGFLDLDKLNFNRKI